MKKIASLLVLSLLTGMIIPVSAQARAINAQEKKRIECAMFKMGVMANYFDSRVAESKRLQPQKYPQACGKRPKGKEEVSVPKWLPDELKNMEKLKVVYVPGQGTLSEATLWYRVLANVYSYLDNANKALNPSQPIVFEQLSRRYMTNRLNLVSNLDQLNKELSYGDNSYNMKDSMQGRARAMLATLEVINQEMYSTVEALSSPVSQREDKYRKSVMAVVELANQLWYEFRTDPLPNKVPDVQQIQNTVQDNLFTTLMLVLGAFLVGWAVYALFENKRDSIEEGWNQYREKSMAWAEDFNRQFLTIDVKYIVFGTLAVFMLLGLLIGISIGGFSGVFFFILLVIAGAYIGIKMPKIVLEHLKKSRGVKINSQLMDALILLSNSLRSGMDIVQGFELVSHDLRPPIADEFGLVIKNYQLGTPFEKALEGMDERVDSRMLSYIIKAIIIQRQVGGNLTVIFSRLVENIREESKLEEKLDAMTAQQKIQATVVGIMPVLMLGVMFVFRPDEMLAFYTQPVGLFVLFFCFVWIMIGMQLIKKLGEVKV